MIKFVLNMRVYFLLDPLHFCLIGFGYKNRIKSHFSNCRSPIKFFQFQNHCHKSIWIAKNKKRFAEINENENTIIKFGGKSFPVRADKKMLNCKVKSHRGWSSLNKSCPFCIFEVNNNWKVTKFLGVIIEKNKP